MSIDISSNSKLSIVKHVSEQFRDLLQDRQETQQTWMRCILAYLCQFDKAWANAAKAANRSARYVPVTFDSIETVLAQAADIIFGNDEWNKVLPAFYGGNDRTDDEYAAVVTKFMRHQFEAGGFYEMADIGMKQLLLVGNCPWSMRWKVKKAADFGQYRKALAEWEKARAEYESNYAVAMQQYQAIMDLAKMTGMVPPPPPQIAPPPQPPVNSRTIFEGPVPVIGDIFNYVEEPFPGDPEEAFRAHRTWRSKEYLRRVSKPNDDGYRLYEGIDAITGGEDRAAAEGNQEENLLRIALGQSVNVRKPNDVELIHAEGTFEVPTADGYETFENYVAVVANGQHLIRFEKTPLISGRRTLNNAKLIRINGSQYGIGIIEKALSEQDSVNAIHNQVIDAVHCVIQPEYARVRNSVTSPKPSGPGQVHDMADQGDIMPFQKNFSGIPLGSAEVNAAIGRFERVTGAINTAPQGRGQESATRTARNANIVQLKLGKWTRAIEKDFIQRMVQTMIDMNAQYIGEEKMFRISQTDPSGQSWMKISPEALSKGWLCEIASTQYVIDKQERIQNGMAFLQMVSQPVFVPAIEWQKLLEQLSEDIMGRRGSGIVKSGPEIGEQMNQIALMVAGLITPPSEQQPEGEGGDPGQQGAPV